MTGVRESFQLHQKRQRDYDIDRVVHLVDGSADLGRTLTPLGELWRRASQWLKDELPCAQTILVNSAAYFINKTFLYVCFP